MKKKSGATKTNKLKIAIIVLAIVAFAAIGAYTILNNHEGNYFEANGIDFSAGAVGLNSIGSAANANIFENVRLNPFEETPT